MLGTLRGRLLALFFLVALIPSLGLTLFVTQYLARSLATLRNPETERALSQSLEVIRTHCADIIPPAEMGRVLGSSLHELLHQHGAG